MSDPFEHLAARPRRAFSTKIFGNFTLSMGDTFQVFHAEDVEVSPRKRINYATDQMISFA
jgi:hypothetical protein